MYVEALIPRETLTLPPHVPMLTPNLPGPPPPSPAPFPCLVSLKTLRPKQAAELSVTVDALHLFQWPGVEERPATGADFAAAAAPAVFSEPDYAGLAAYLNAVLPPGGGWSEWVVPAAAAAAGGGCNGDGSNDADFLSTPLAGSWRTRPPVTDSGAMSVLRGGAPAAALCLSEAVHCGAPSLGLRVLLEIVRPPPTPAGEVEPSMSGSIASGGGGESGGQAALYRAIAVLVAANRRSPLTRPVVVLTDLCSAWKIIWLGGARSGAARRGEGEGGVGVFPGTLRARCSPSCYVLRV